MIDIDTTTATVVEAAAETSGTISSTSSAKTAGRTTSPRFGGGFFLSLGVS
jgi:hypothetical protein